MTTPDLKKLAEVKTFTWSSGGMKSGFHWYSEPREYVLYSDHRTAIAALLQEVDTLREDAECWRYYKDLLAQYNTSITQLLTQSARHEEAAPQAVDPSGFSMGDPHPCDAPQDGETKP